MAIFRPPQNKHPLTDHQQIWYRWLHRRPLRLRQIWCKSVDGGLLGKWVKYNEIFLYIPFIHELTYTNPRWRTAAILKTVKSPYLCNRLNDFDEMWHDDAHWPPTADRPLKFWIFENSRWLQPPSWKSQKSRYFRNYLTDLYEIWYADAKWVS